MILGTNIKSAEYIKAHNFLKFLFLGEVFSPRASKLKKPITQNKETQYSENWKEGEIQDLPV